MKKYVSTIHFLKKKTPKFKRWTTLLERMPKMSTSYCLWLCSCSCLFQTLIFLNFKKQLWMQSLPSKLGGVGVPFFGGNAVFSPVFKKGGKKFWGESWQSHPHLASILEFEWSTWKHVYSARVCCFVETGSVREAFFYLDAFLMDGQKDAGIPALQAGLTSAVLWILLAKELCCLHSLTFSEGAMFTRISSDISGGMLEWGRICETKIVVSSTVWPLLLTQSQSNWFRLSFLFQPRLCRLPLAQDSGYVAGNFFYRFVSAVNPDTAGFENHRNIRQRKLFGVLVDLPRMGDWVSIAALPAAAAHLNLYSWAYSSSAKEE